MLYQSNKCMNIKSVKTLHSHYLLSELLRKSAENILMDMVQLLFSRLPQFKEDPKWASTLKRVSICFHIVVFRSVNYSAGYIYTGHLLTAQFFSGNSFNVYTIVNLVNLSTWHNRTVLPSLDLSGLERDYCIYK